MKVFMYAVYDVASGVYDGPIPGQADGLMIRKFTDMCLNADSDVGKHPADFTLFRVGTWNDGTSEIENCDSVKLINGVEALSASRNVDGKQLSLIDEKISDEDKFVDGNVSSYGGSA